MGILPVESGDGYGRDSGSGAIVCTDVKKLAEFKRKRNLERRVEILEKQVQELMARFAAKD